ncbi:hypothetical protein C8N40_102440 [Pontibacter mucosus]|uniref:Glycosyl transferase family 1 n=1 Tax=Pontibacter mucosus TaxID=1649266 RepID=A0A2T5YQ87_9BACT|nr:glycosyltransferase [Pontibacter mucosus]PTX21464.1 hypothetical protein C8N40_102440 [Pontibacter mucosus]
MKILFLNANIPNYVTDGLFHGLHSIPGIMVVDVPRMNYMYKDATYEDLCKTGSKGNTLYGLLQEDKNVQGKRTYWQADIDQYDLIVFSDIFEQCDLFNSIYKSISAERRRTLCIVDGYDIATLFPYFNFFFNLRVRPWSFLYSTRGAQYFKREYNNSAELYGFAKDRYASLNAIFSVFLRRPKNRFYTITMSVPEEIIEYVPYQSKLKDFVDYNVDPELDSLFPNREAVEVGKWLPSFENQCQYYQDIKNSRFGITTRRAGWDCLRHYEYAAMGAILCFKNLNSKSKLCAPLDLDKTNCIPYSDKEDLIAKIRRKTTGELESIQEAQYKWVSGYTTKAVANKFIAQVSG